MQGLWRPARLRYEVQVIGLWLLLLPPGAVLGLGLLVLVLDSHGVNRGFTAQLLTASLEACLPLTAGIAVAQVAARDAAVELLLTLPVAYRFIALGRIALILGWTALTGLAATWAVRLAFPWALPPLAGTLIWLAPALWLGGAGALLPLLLRNRAAGGAVLGSIWVSQLAFHGYFAATGWTQPVFLFATLEGTYQAGLPLWWTNRLDLFLGAAVLFVVVWWYLRHPEWRLRAEDG